MTNVSVDLKNGNEKASAGLKVWLLKKIKAWVNSLPISIQCISYGLHPPVHHVGRSDDIGSRLGMSQRRFRQQLQSGVVENFIALDHAAMAMVGVLVNTDIGDDHHLGYGRFYLANGALDDAIGIVGLGTNRILFVWNSKQYNSWNSQGMALLDLFQNIVNRAAKNPGH